MYISSYASISYLYLRLSPGLKKYKGKWRLGFVSFHRIFTLHRITLIIVYQSFVKAVRYDNSI